jgi:predicted ATPase
VGRFSGLPAQAVTYVLTDVHTHTNDSLSKEAKYYFFLNEIVQNAAYSNISHNLAKLPNTYRK